LLFGGAVGREDDEGVQAGGDAVGGKAGDGGYSVKQEFASATVAQAGGADVAVVGVSGDRPNRCCTGNCPVKTLAGLSLAPEHRRGHGALSER
jgi:hypothetical protein